MSIRSLVAALALELVLCAVAIKTTPDPIAWYDMVAVLLLASVPAVLIVLMSLDTREIDAGGIAFGITFAGMSLLYYRAVFGVFGISLLQSRESLWLIRLLIIAGLTVLLAISIDQLASGERSWRSSFRRLGLLMAIVATLWLAVKVAQWVDWSEIGDRIRIGMTWREMAVLAGIALLAGAFAAALVHVLGELIDRVLRWRERRR